MIPAREEEEKRERLVRTQCLTSAAHCLCSHSNSLAPLPPIPSFAAGRRQSNLVNAAIRSGKRLTLKHLTQPSGVSRVFHAPGLSRQDVLLFESSRQIYPAPQSWFKTRIRNGP